MAAAEVKHAHLYGILWEPAIAPFAWMCHHYGLSLSCSNEWHEYFSYVNTNKLKDTPELWDRWKKDIST